MIKISYKESVKCVINTLIKDLPMEVPFEKKQKVDEDLVVTGHKEGSRTISTLARGRIVTRSTVKRETKEIQKGQSVGSTRGTN